MITRVYAKRFRVSGVPLGVNTPGSDEERIELKELMDMCTKLSDRVLDLENVKNAQALEIQKLKKRFKKLESKKKSRTPQLKRRLFKFQEDSETQGRYGHDIGVNTASISITTASINITTAEPVTTASAPVTTAGVSVSTAEPSTPLPPTTTTTPIEDEDLTIAQTLIKMKSEKSKAKGVTMQEPSESGTRVRVPPPQINPKDKGKAKMVVLEKPKKKKDQIEYDADVAQRLQAELDEEARLKKEREVEASKAANIAEEQGEISIEERSKLFVELMNETKKHFTRLRAEDQRRKPPTKTQKRNLMSTYLKNMDGYKNTQLKNISFKEIQMLFEKEMKRVNVFVDMDEELVKGSETMESEVDRAVPELAAGSSKRDAEEELDQESSKRQKTGESSELAEKPRVKEADELLQEELQQMMIIVPEQGMNVEALQTKYLIIDWEIYTEGTRNLVKEKFNSTEPTDDKEREIWVELKRLFEPDTDDELWKLQKHIRLYDSCRVHHVSTEKGIDIYMLVKKEYPLSRGTLTLMLVAKLLVDQDNEMSKELLRKIFMQGRIVGIKRLLSVVEVNAASYDCYYCWFKLQLLENVRLSEEEEKDFQWRTANKGFVGLGVRVNHKLTFKNFIVCIKDRDLMNELTRKEHYAFFRVFAKDYGTMGLRYGTPNLSAGATFVQSPLRQQHQVFGAAVEDKHEGYRNTIELLVGNNVVPLRSDTIRLVQNGCSFYGLRSEDPNQHPEVDLGCLVDIGAGTGTREVPSFDGLEPQPLLNSTSLDVSPGGVIGPEPPIKPHRPDSSRMKVVDYLTTQTPPLPHVANSHPKGVYSYYNPGIDDPKRHYGFKTGLLGKSVSLGVDISN
ncbi:hypothetical protein Tco_0060557 [Tanacetum coccineum]